MRRRGLIVAAVFLMGLIVVGQAHADVTSVNDSGSELQVTISGTLGDSLTVGGSSSSITIAGVNGSPTFTGSGCTPTTEPFLDATLTCTGNFSTVQILGTGSKESETVDLNALTLGSAGTPGTLDVELGTGADTLDDTSSLGAALYYGPTPTDTTCASGGDGSSNTVTLEGSITAPVTVCGAGTNTVTMTGATFSASAPLDVSTGTGTGQVDLDGASFGAGVNVTDNFASSGTGASEYGVNLSNAVLGGSLALATGASTDNVDLDCLQDPNPSLLSVTTGSGGGEIDAADAALGTTMTDAVASSCGVTAVAGNASAGTPPDCSTTPTSGFYVNTGTGTETVDLTTINSGMAICVAPANANTPSAGDSVTVSGSLGAALSISTNEASATPSTLNLKGVSDLAATPITVTTGPGKGDSVDFDGADLDSAATINITTGSGSGDVVDFQPTPLSSSASVTITTQGANASVTTNPGDTVTVDEAGRGSAVDLSGQTGSASFTTGLTASDQTQVTTVGGGPTYTGLSKFTTTDNSADVVYPTQLAPGLTVVAGSTDQTLEFTTGAMTSDNLTVDLPSNTVKDLTNASSETFTSFDNAVGGSGQDTIDAVACPDSPADSACGHYSGGTGSDNTIDFAEAYPTSATDLTVDLSVSGSTSTAIPDGTAADGTASYTLTGFQNAIGGDGTNTFIPSSSYSGSYGGTHGTNQVSYADAAAPVVDMDFGAQTATLPNVTALGTTTSTCPVALTDNNTICPVTDSFTDVTGFTGGSGADTVDLSGFSSDTVAFAPNTGVGNTLDLHEITTGGTIDFPSANTVSAGSNGTSYGPVATVVGTGGTTTFAAQEDANVAIVGAPLTGTNATGDNVLSYAGDTSPVTVDLTRATDNATGLNGAGTLTVSNIQTVDGGGGTATLTAGNANVTLEAEDGNGDVLTAGNGTDTLKVGTGADDQLTAGDGPGDKLSATDGKGDILMVGGGAGDVETAGDGDGDAITAGSGNGDELTAGSGAADVLIAGDGDNDTLTATDGDGDTLTGGNGNDVALTAGAGNDDTLNAGTGYDILTSGDGTGDQLNGSQSGGTGELITQTSLGTINPGAGTYYVNGSLDGTGAENTIDGGTGANVIIGANEDTISFEGQSSAVTIDLTGASDSGAAGQNESITGIDNAIGGAVSTTFIGNGQNDILEGTQGTNVFEPGTGNATLEGGATAGSGSNTISFARAAPSDAVTVNLANGSASDGNATDRLIAIDSAILGPGPGTFIGGQGYEHVTGGSGNDTFTGGPGGDAITTGNGNNTIQVGSGADTITTGSGANFINLRNNTVANTVTCGTGANTVLAKANDSVTNCSNALFPAPTLGGNQAPPPPPTTTTQTTPPPPPPVYNPVSATLTSHFSVIKTAPKLPKAKKGKTQVKPVDTKGYTRITLLELKKVGAGTTIVATCKGVKAKNCPFKQDTLNVAQQTATYTLKGLFGDVPVPPHVTFTLRLSQSGATSRIYTFAFTLNKLPKETIQCQLPTAGSKVGACPAA